MKLLACSQCLSSVDEGSPSSSFGRLSLSDSSSNPVFLRSLRPQVKKPPDRRTSFSLKKPLPRVFQVLASPWRSKKSKPRTATAERRHKVKKRDLARERKNSESSKRCSDESSRFYLEPLSPERIEKIKSFDGEREKLFSGKIAQGVSDDLEEEYYAHLEALKFFIDPPNNFKDSKPEGKESNEAEKLGRGERLSTLDFRLMNTVGLVADNEEGKFCVVPLDEAIQEHVKIERAVFGEPILRRKCNNKSNDKRDGKSVRFMVENFKDEEIVVNSLKTVQREAEELNETLARKISSSSENLRTDFLNQLIFLPPTDFIDKTITGTIIINIDICISREIIFPEFIGSNP